MLRTQARNARKLETEVRTAGKVLQGRRLLPIKRDVAVVSNESSRVESRQAEPSRGDRSRDRNASESNPLSC